MVVANGISKSFGEITAVDNISFTIKDGEITGLLGPNGAGKTTTLRMITCFLSSDSGSIRVGEYDVEENPVEVRRIIGYLPESAPIYGDMLVYDYLNYIADMRRIDDKGRLKEMGELCGISNVMHQNIGELSKGYKQRVGLATTMMHDPDILILDEPTNGLDPNQIIEIRNLIKEIGKKKTVILSTHILSEVEATCDRVIIIDRGTIVADDRTSILRSSGGKNIIVRVAVTGADYNEYSEKFKTIDGVVDVQVLSGHGLPTVEVTAAEDKDVRPEIFKVVCDNNWVLYEMSQEQRSLENVFRDLTAGGRNGE